MGAAFDRPETYPEEGKEAQKSDDEESAWDIIENGHRITHRDFLFGVPQKMRVKDKEDSGRRTRRRSRKQRPVAPQQWVSRLYIDPPTSPKVTPTSKMEVKVMIDQGKVTHIENARALPPEIGSMEQGGKQQRTVSYLHLCVSRAESNLQIKPIDKGDFTLPCWADLGTKLDVSQHQVLCSLLRRSSMAWAPDDLKFFPLYQPDDETSRQYTLWNSSDALDRKERHMHLLEEVKLIQHAITKFKVEFRVLDLRSQTLYNQDPESLTTEQRSELVELGNLRSQIIHEINELERLLADRMRTILRTDTSLYTGDLASLQTVHQVVEVLKEQVYHSSIINGLSLSRFGQDDKSTADSVSQGSASSESELVKQLSLLQDHIEEHQSKTTTQLTTTMEQMRQSLLAEVRESVREETKQLRKQVLESEMEVRDLKKQLQVYTNIPTGVVKPESKKAEVRFPISGSPADPNRQVSFETVTKTVSLGKEDAEFRREGQVELHVSRSQHKSEAKSEVSPRESVFPLAKWGLYEEPLL